MQKCYQQNDHDFKLQLEFGFVKSFVELKSSPFWIPEGTHYVLKLSTGTTQTY